LIHCAVFIFTYVKEMNIDTPPFRFCKSQSINRKSVTLCSQGTHQLDMCSTSVAFYITSTFSRILKKSSRFTKDWYLISFSVQGTKESTNLIIISMSKLADHSGRAAQGMSCLRPLKYWDRGFEFHSRHGSQCTFIPYLYCRVCR
jgi:hypothetical protein